ncbi:sensor domain-containing diguanylate cyclase [Glaciecola petra]|uniref:Sensor domain-containing diguanylate cyclase n=1 Tax=Glaciecola petra TaxID=3075602 RepID=A0ABU2ZUS0_9ALTE|nr:sensor domain-containing diguanylate cyclase [Aestuariibacter sp. P117]MDT0596384.1 sensor domain-containing diguanylate cyclase [Aestuariibacter sp. P117]
MKIPSLPRNEILRLATLNDLNILDTECDERFDRVTRLAQRLFDVPICLVSLIDENRQWFKSCVGLNASETGRDISFCGHSILGEDVFVVFDAALDKRFEDNPLVTGEPHIRFYAGYPLNMPNQTKMGTLCIIDTKPKLFTDSDKQALKDFGKIIEETLVSMYLSEIDDLTGLSNRRGFYHLSTKSLSYCSRHQHNAFLLYFDLDNFKELNDTFGHKFGDEVLVKFANILSDSFRESDAVGRIGGDEFAILMIAESQKNIHDAISRLESVFQSLLKNDEKYSKLGFSYGHISIDDNNPQSIIDLIDDADKKMYVNKRSKS